MVQGTSSNAGKSVLVAALCRIYKNKGYKVAPFKSQNMSLNSYTTKEDGEIGIAQMLQAEAAKVEPSVHMNPILLKPKGEFTSNVIIQGKSIGDMDFYKYQHEYHDEALKAIKESLSILEKEYDVIIIEGAGSPAEINMRKEDLANMEIAHLADANVILVADIEMGGVFAAIAGTYALLDDYDRSRLKATVINKFRGNLDILKPGIDRIEEITEQPVLGVLPYDESLRLPEEDSASLTTHVFDENKDITIGVIRLPKISNFTDIDPFEYEEDVGIKMININDDIGDVDALIIPGTRNSTEDAYELFESGIAEKIIFRLGKVHLLKFRVGIMVLSSGSVVFQFRLCINISSHSDEINHAHIDSFRKKNGFRLAGSGNREYCKNLTGKYRFFLKEKESKAHGKSKSLFYKYAGETGRAEPAGKTGTADAESGNESDRLQWSFRCNQDSFRGDRQSVLSATEFRPDCCR